VGSALPLDLVRIALQVGTAVVDDFSLFSTQCQQNVQLLDRLSMTIYNHELRFSFNVDNSHQQPNFHGFCSKRLVLQVPEGLWVGEQRGFRNYLEIELPAGKCHGTHTYGGFQSMGASPNHPFIAF